LAKNIRTDEHSIFLASVPATSYAAYGPGPWAFTWAALRR
jgi:hypothetical protein